MRYHSKNVHFSTLKKGDLFCDTHPRACGGFLMYTATTDACEIPSSDGTDWVIEAKCGSYTTHLFASSFENYGNVKLFIKIEEAEALRNAEIDPNVANEILQEKHEVPYRPAETIRKHLSNIVKGDVFFFRNIECTAIDNAHLVPGSRRQWRVTGRCDMAVGCNEVQTIRLSVDSDQCPDGMVDVMKKVDVKVTHTSTCKLDHYTVRTDSGTYVLSAIPNAFNDNIGWWLSKQGYTVAMYCFSTTAIKDVFQKYQVKHQMENIDSYISLFETRFCKHEEV